MIEIFETCQTKSIAKQTNREESLIIRSIIYIHYSYVIVYIFIMNKYVETNIFLLSKQPLKQVL